MNIKWYLSFGLGALFGALVFVSLYGIRILDVTYDDWLLTGWYDLSQHYVGWKLYRVSGWHFPVGLCDTSFYPYLASVIYTDSIPLICFFFKLLSPVLPETFQFFGLYGLFCFMMQGGVAKLLLRKVLKNELYCCIGCIPFIFCAPLWQRMFYHTALASHYLILMGFLLFMYRERLDRLWKRVLLWCVLGVLCVSIHFTIYGMVSVMLLGFALLEALDTAGRKAALPGQDDEKEGKNTAADTASNDGKTALLRSIGVFGIYLLSYLFATVFTFYLFGGFYGGISGESEGLGSFSANLNSLFNPIDYSRIIRDQPLIECQYEGLSYIGIMAVIFMIPAVAYIARKRAEIWRCHRNLIISIFAVSVILWIIALSPKVTLGSHILFEIPVPGPVYSAWSIFRASGRFLWPVMYALILIVLYYAKYEIRSYFAAVMVLGCLLQIYEFSDKVYTTSYSYSRLKEAHFTADYLDLYSWEGIKHLQFMHDYYFGEFYGDYIRDQMIGYTQFALRNGMTVSNFHFSRDDMNKLRGRIEECERLLEAGTPEEDTIYVFRKEDVNIDELQQRYSGVTYIFTDDEIIAVPEKAGSGM
ncbi:MAG: hypothetical protein J5966_06440 [Lachnospiraceae bacterium]|nr:hypothetical protein [Lachnospiraceae bacterium]